MLWLAAIECGSLITNRFKQAIESKGWKLSNDCRDLLLYLEDGELKAVISALDDCGESKVQKDEQSTIAQAMLLQAIKKARDDEDLDLV